MLLIPRLTDDPNKYAIYLLVSYISGMIKTC